MGNMWNFNRTPANVGRLLTGVLDMVVQQKDYYWPLTGVLGVRMGK
jgi:hypothetical protein